MSSCGGGSSSGNNGGSQPTASPVNQTLFVDRTAESGIQFVKGYLNPKEDYMPEEFGGGVAAGDYDNDGDVDLFIVRGDIGKNLLYRNDGNNSFIDVAFEAGVASTKPDGGVYRHSGPVFADMDGDGDLDLFIGGISTDPSLLFRNNGNGTFSDVTVDSGIDLLTARETVSVAFGDYDLDGDLDLMMAHWGTYRPEIDGGPSRGDTESLWRNESDQNRIRFVSVSEEAEIAPVIIVGNDGLLQHGEKGLDFDYTFTPAFARLNDDLYPDIIAVADFANTRVFLNNGEQSSVVTFEDVTDNDVITDQNGMGLAVGDLDNDGDLDWFVTGIKGSGQPFGNRLYRNEGGGVFTDASINGLITDGSWGWGACIADFNLDGVLDIFHVNGWEDTASNTDYENDTSRLFIGQGGLSYKEQARELGLADKKRGLGVVCADFDNDGDVDIFNTANNRVNSSSFWENIQVDNNFLKVSLKGVGPNTEAAGARIKVTVGSVTQMREIMIGNNFTSQNPTEQIFGLGEGAVVDMVEIEWPDGVTEEFVDVPAGSVVYTQSP